MGKSKKGKHAQPHAAQKPKHGFSAFGKAVAERVYGPSTTPARPSDGEVRAAAAEQAAAAAPAQPAAPEASRPEAASVAAAASQPADPSQLEATARLEAVSQPAAAIPPQGSAAPATSPEPPAAEPAGEAPIPDASASAPAAESAAVTVALEPSMPPSELQLDGTPISETETASDQQVEQLSLEQLAHDVEKRQQARAAQEKATAQKAAHAPQAPGREFTMPRQRFGKPQPMGVSQPDYLPTYQVNPNPPKGSHRRAMKVAAITATSIIGVLLAVYLAGAFVFMGRFFPHSSIIGMDISGKTPDEVEQMLDGMLSDYTFKVEGFGLNLTLSAADMGMTLDSQSIADGLLSQMDPWAWPIEVFRHHDDTEDLASTFKDTKLAETLQAAVEDVNATATPPKNALVAYDPEAKEYVIVPEEGGETLLADEVIRQVADGAVNFAPKVQLTSAVLAQPTVNRYDQGLVRACRDANAVLAGAIDLMMAGEVALSVNADVLSEHLTFAEDGAVSLDIDAIVTWVQDAVNNLDTVGATRTYTRADGKEITVEGGDYGWITNSQETANAVRAALEAGTGGPMDIVMKWSAGQLPDGNGRDFGARYIDVDISEQYARFYGDDGSIIWESDIVSGRPSDGRSTPRGTYYLKTNDGGSTLRGYKPDGTIDYETPVKYWMPFKGNSVGFHDADWQARFGGDWYVSHGSHGCVNLPPSKARALHEIIKVGDAVVVHD